MTEPRTGLQLSLVEKILLADIVFWKGMLEIYLPVAADTLSTPCLFCLGACRRWMTKVISASLISPFQPTSINNIEIELKLCLKTSPKQHRNKTLIHYMYHFGELKLVVLLSLTVNP